MDDISAAIRRIVREEVERAFRAHDEKPADIRQMDASPSGAPEWLTEQQVSELIGVSVSTLQGWRVHEKGPPFKKVGRMVRYPREDLAEWQRSQ